MNSSVIQAIYVFDQNNEVVLEHIYLSRPPSARSCLSSYISLSSPRPAVTYHASLSPPVTLMCSRYNGLLFMVPCTQDSDPLATLTFLGRFVDILEEFLGGPLTSAKISSSYDIVAQILTEVVDGGQIATTETNALRDSITTQGWVDKLLGGVGLPSGPVPSLGAGSSGFGIGSGGSGLGSLGSAGFRSSGSPVNSGPQLPWRRPNVRHTSNELYVDMLEELKVLLAPSGRPLSARVHGSILFTARISGIPDLILSLGANGGGPNQINKMVKSPAFHPCVRLNRWRDRPGEISFIPPDGKFMLAGYEVDLLPPPSSQNGGLVERSTRQLDLPVNIEIKKGLGQTGMEFEVRLTISGNLGAKSASGTAAAHLRAISNQRGTGGGSGRSTPSLFGSRDSGTSSSPTLSDITVQVFLPSGIRNITDMRSSRGEASFNNSTRILEWRILSKETSTGGIATLRCTAVSNAEEHGDEEDTGISDQTYGVTTGMGEYDETMDAYQDEESALENTNIAATTNPVSNGKVKEQDTRKVNAGKLYMPTAATVSFSIKGWLASGLKVESLNIDTRKSRGLGDGVKPVKGVKYLTTSREGIESRC